jgi:hypothetical protein
MVAKGLIEPGTPVMVKPVGLDELLRKVRAELDG